MDLAINKLGPWQLALNVLGWAHAKTAGQTVNPAVRQGLELAQALDCWLPASALLGIEGQGFNTAMAVLDRGRVEVAAGMPIAPPRRR